MDHEQIAKELFSQGYNCAQAVFAAFSDITNIDQKTSLRLSSPFGGGIGRMREVCGSVSGMLMVLGAVYGYDDLKDKNDRPVLYGRVQELIKKFNDEHNHFICRDLLKHQEENKEKNISCNDYVGFAAKLIDDFIKNNPQK